MWSLLGLGGLCKLENLQRKALAIIDYPALFFCDISALLGSLHKVGYHLSNGHFEIQCMRIYFSFFLLALDAMPDNTFLCGRNLLTFTHWHRKNFYTTNCAGYLASFACFLRHMLDPHTSDFHWFCWNTFKSGLPVNSWHNQSNRLYVYRPSENVWLD